MNPNPKTISAGAIVLAITSQVFAQYAPPPPPQPFSGFLNEYLRAEDPYWKHWDFGGSVRERFEDKSGFAIPGSTGSLDFRDHGADVENDYFLTKIKFHTSYSDSWWGAYLEGQSSLAVGDERFAYANNPAVAGTVIRKGDGPESDSIDLHQAFLTIGNQKEFPLSLKVGRQEMTYGEERLIGTFAWNNIGRTFDAAKLRWQNEWFGADFFVSHPVIPEDGRFDVDNRYDYFSGVYANTAKIPKTILEAYLLARNSSPKAISAVTSPEFPQPSARDVYTAGGRVKSKPGEIGNWDYTVEGAYQFGDFRDNRLGVSSARLRQDAFMAIVQGGYTFTNLWSKPRLGFEYTYSSGDGNPNDGKHETFDNLFPTNHRFYGYMDFISLQNIQDARGILQLRPHPRVSVALEGHGFWLADTHDNLYTAAGTPRGGIAATPGNNYGINPNYGRFVGTELDLIAGVAVTRFAQLEAGYGHFFVGDYIRESLAAPTVGSKDANYVYVQATINF
ncbi:MAG TPA: alginate export family protein [Verrucomicrobiae bacterium]|nr:alginate export family protein [Verrucomicrobiae bacterium]